MIQVWEHCRVLCELDCKLLIFNNTLVKTMEVLNYLHYMTTLLTDILKTVTGLTSGVLSLEVGVEFMLATRQHNEKLNLDKLQFKNKQASFFHTTFTSDGHKPRDYKVQAINKISQPADRRDIQCFLGMVNYLNKYSPLRFPELGGTHKVK